jgi:hypothetical protein
MERFSSNRIFALSIIALSIIALRLILAAPALAGPPLICHPVDIGAAQSLPWPSEGGNLAGRSDYDVSHLVSDTLRLLNPDMRVLVRMETLRRATIYVQRDPVVAKQLLLELHSRTTANPDDALAEFDFGYLVECYKQAQIARREGLSAWGHSKWPNPAAQVDGYELVKGAIRLRGQDPEMEFAAALIAEMGSRSDCQEHIRRAVAGSKQDALLTQNLASHFGKGTVSQSLAKSPGEN